MSNFKEAGKENKNEVLNWDNLTRYRCPRDNKKLSRNIMLDIYTCNTCNFKIRNERMAEIAFGIEAGDDHFGDYFSFFKD